MIAKADMGQPWFVQRRWTVGFPPDPAFFIITNDGSTNEDELVTDVWVFRYAFTTKRVVCRHG